MNTDIIEKLHDGTVFIYKGRLKYAELEKPMHLKFWVPVPKVVEVIP